jgi:hypothetical protein
MTVVETSWTTGHEIAAENVREGAILGEIVRPWTLLRIDVRETSEVLDSKESC